MDTSETYIKMCEQATEIQKLRYASAYDRSVQRYVVSGNWEDGDIFVADGIDYIYGGDCYSLTSWDGVMDLGSAGYCEGAGGTVHKVIWLPRQDQLQEMVKEDAITLHQRMTEFILRYAYVPLGLPQPSFEQLWLAFVMKAEYDKVWHNGEWVRPGVLG